MAVPQRYYTSVSKILKSLGLVAILLFLLIPVSVAQNTKGDRPEVRSGGKRESKFRASPKKKSKSKKPYNRVQSRRSSPANAARASKPGKPTKNIYPQKGKFVNNQSRTAKISKHNQRSSPSRVSARSATGRTRNVYPQRGPYVNNPSRKPRTVERPVSNRTQLARVKRYSTPQTPPGKKKRVAPASASRPYVTRRSINAFAGFWNQKPKGEKAYTRGDIAGRKIRGKNFETKRQKVIKPTTTPYYGRKRVGDRPYKGPAGGGYVSATQPGKAWSGDIAGRKIRGRNYSSKTTIEGKPIFPPRKSRARVGDRPYKGTVPGGGYKSVTGKVRGGGKGPIPVRTPGIGAKGVDTYQGNIRGGKVFSPQGVDYAGNLKARKPLKGGGSVSGSWNNKGRAIAGRYPGKGAEQVGTYSGNIKFRKPLKGGGSISGKQWNNQGRAIQGKTPGIGANKIDTYQGNIKGRKTFTPQGEEYSGNIKARTPVKGGGSISGKMWNNQGRAIQGKSPGIGADKIDTYQGNIKGGRKIFDTQGADYTGNIKAKKPVKGGGSISGKLWNNREQPIPGKTPGGVADKIDTYQGNSKVTKKEPGKDVGGFPGKHHEFDFHPSMQNQGEEFTGYIRLPRFKKQYVKNPNAADEALKKTRPDKSTYQVDGLQVKVKQKDYQKRPNAAEGAMMGIAPGKNSIKASEYSKAIRLKWDYKHNPNSAEEALKTREPGKAFVRATDYQGNIKMKSFKVFKNKELHPDAQFVKMNKNNTDEERGMLTNFKLWWARLFKKSDTQPDHLKEKIRKPRYDKGEQGMWYD